MKSLIKITGIWFVIVFALVSCATYSIAYESRVVGTETEGPGVTDGLVSSYKSSDNVVIEPLPDKEGYTFLGWAEEGKSSSEAVKTYTFTDAKSDKKIVAYWDLVNYVISYNSRLSDESYDSSLSPVLNVKKLELPVSYNIESGAFVRDISGTEDGYEFTGWVEDGKSFSPVKSVTVEKGETGDRTFVSVWNLERYPLTFSSRFVSGSDWDASLVPELPQMLDSYTVADKGAVLPELSKPGYVFVGWIEEGADESSAVKTYTLEDGVFGEKNIVALWDLERYSIEYSSRFSSSLDYDSSLVPELPALLDSYTIADVGAVLPELSKPGYVFIGWIVDGADESTAVKSYTLKKGDMGNKKLVALWNLERYSIEYSSRFVSSLDYDSSLIPELPALPDSYTIADIGAVLPELSKPGYVFLGWIIDGADESTAVKSYTLEDGVLGDKRVVALWDFEGYSIEYSSRFASSLDYDTSLIPELPALLDSYTVADVGAVLPELSKPGYVFIGWIENGADESTAVKSYTLEEGVLGDKRVVALWDLEKYSLTFTARFIEGDDYDESLVPSLPVLLDSYTLADEGAVLPELSKPGYIFKGWIVDGADESTAVKTYTLEDGVLGDKNIVALWDLEVYSVKAEARFIEGVECSDKFLPELPSLTETYTIANVGAVLPELSEPGYIFIGWIVDGADESTAVKSYTLEDGVLGDKRVVALWDFEGYSIEYSSRFASSLDYDTSLIPELPALLDSYTVADVGAVLPELSKPGYVFIGWIENGADESTAVKSYTLEEGVLGDKRVVALWDLEKYSLTFTARFIEGDDYDESLVPSLPVLLDSYTLADEGAVLPELSKPGYIFKGWIEEGNDESTAVMSYTLEDGVLGEKTIVALWDLEKYTLTFEARFIEGADYDESLVPSLPVLLDSYSAQDIGAVLPELSEPGYIFKGWIEEGADESTAVMSYTLEEGVIGEKNIVALWDLEKYSLTYSARFIEGDNYDESLVPSLPVLLDSYTIADKGAVLPELSKPGYVFKGWIEDSADEDTAVKTYTLEDGVLGDKNIVALWDLEVYSFTAESRFIKGVECSEKFLPELPQLLDSYTIADVGAVLPELLEPGYIFMGWIENGMDESSAVMSYTLEEGVLGDKSVVALWNLISYPVTYTARFVEGVGYPESALPVLPHLMDTYTVADVGAVLPELFESGYIFKGWIEDGSDESTAVLTYTLKKGSLGDRKVVALWDVVNYPITYDEDGIIANDPVEVPEPEMEAAAEPEVVVYENRKSYTIEDEVTFINPVREGFTFIGWIEKDQGVDDADKDYRIEAGTIGDKELVAVWHRNEYSIAYDLNDGRFEEEAASSYMYDDKAGVPLTTPVRDSYIFTGWVDEASGEVFSDLFTDTAVGHDVVLEALWTPVVYTISYDLNGGEMEGEKNPETYTYETETFTLITPVRSGYRFTGWSCEETVEFDPVIFTLTFSVEGVDIEVRMHTKKSEWVLPSYFTKEFIELAQSFLSSNFPEAEISRNGNIITLDWQNSDSSVLEALVSKIAGEAGFVYEYEKTRNEIRGYSDITIAQGSSGDRKYRAEWEIVTYTLTYGSEEPYDVRFPLPEPEAPVNPTTYTVNDDTFTLINPERFGYDFMGWVLDDEEYTEARMTVSIEKGSTDNRVYTPLFKVHDYSLVLDLSGGEGEYPRTFTIYDGEISLERPVKEHYVFLGWSDESGKNIGKDAVVDCRSGENCVLTALWEPVVYSIKYDLDGGEYLKGEENIATYNVELENYVLVSPVKKGYTFAGWSTGEDDKPVVGRVLDASNGMDRSFKAVWTLDSHRIIYNLGGGSFADVEAEEYTIVDKVELASPERYGYTFLGWIDGDGNKVTYVDTSLCTDQVFTALWKAVEYSVKYDLRGGSYEIGTVDNITSYTVETPQFLLTNPVRDSYKFAGWVSEEREGRDYAKIDYVIETAKGGDLSLVAQWKKAEYTITYNLDGGEFDYLDSNPVSFTNFDSEFTLVSPHKDGYSFLGWIEEGNDGYRPVKDYVIRTKTLRGDISLKAVWAEDSYKITYYLNGGSYSRGVGPNKTSYKRSDAPFVLQNPVRDGYTFLGWVRSDYSDTDIPNLVCVVNTLKGGNLSYEALWESSEYTIEYNLYGGSYRYGNTNPETYTSDMTFSLAKPYKEGYTFIGWIAKGDSSESVIENVTIEKGTKGDLAFYAVYKENLVALGEVTKMQKRVVELGRDGIPRPDWVIEVPSDSMYHYERAYASGSDFHGNMKAAKEECILNMASWLTSSVTNVTKSVNSVKQVTLNIDRSADVENAELVEYWQDADGGIWVLMRIER